MSEEEKNNLEIGATPFEDDVTEEELALINNTEVEEVSTEAEEETSEAEEEATEEEKKDDPMIPKARLDQEIRNRRNIEQELNEYKERELVKEKDKEDEQLANEASKKKEEYLSELENAFIEGDMRKVASMFEQRDNAVREQAIEEASRIVPNQVMQTQQREEFEKARNSIESAFEFLKPDSENYSQSIVDDIITFSEAEGRKGRTPAEALKLATSKVLLYEKPQEVEKFLKSQGYDTGKQDDVESQRLSSKIEAQKRQPPELRSSVSQDTSLPDFATMSEEDFDKLSQKEIDNYIKKMSAV